MHVAFAGNPNNYPFMLARALRRAGHDVTFVVDRPEPLNRPEARYGDVGPPYPSWIVTSEPIWIDDVVYRTSRWRGLLGVLARADALVLTGCTWPAATELGLPSVCLATGADLDFYANTRAGGNYAHSHDTVDRAQPWLAVAWGLGAIDSDAFVALAGCLPPPLFRAWRRFTFERFMARQRRAFSGATAVGTFPPGTVPVADRLVRELRGTSPSLVLLIADTTEFQPLPLPVNGRLRIFNSARLDWSPPLPPMIGEWENKRGDILLRGVALYLEQGGAPVDLHLAAKGQSLAATRALIDALGLQAVVTWHPEMTQREVLEQYALADVVADQLGNHMPGMSTFDAMALGRPVLANGRPDVMRAAFGQPLPLAHATTPAEVAGQLRRLSNRDERRRLALRARVFAEEHLSSDHGATRVARALRANADAVQAHHVIHSHAACQPPAHRL